MSCEFYREAKIKRTRKEHVCFGCGCKIPKGRSAWHTSGKFEGEMFSSHLCNPCMQELERNSGDYYEGYCMGDLRDARLQRVSDWRQRRDSLAKAKGV